MMCKALNGLVPNYLREKFPYVSQRHKHTLRNSDVNLILPRPNTEYGKNTLVIVKQYYGVLFLVKLGDRETCATLE